MVCSDHRGANLSSCRVNGEDTLPSKVPPLCLLFLDSTVEVEGGRHAMQETCIYHCSTIFPKEPSFWLWTIK